MKRTSTSKDLKTVRPLEGRSEPYSPNRLRQLFHPSEVGYNIRVHRVRDKRLVDGVKEYDERDLKRVSEIENTACNYTHKPFNAKPAITTSAFVFVAELMCKVVVSLPERYAMQSSEHDGKQTRGGPTRSRTYMAATMTPMSAAPSVESMVSSPILLKRASTMKEGKKE